MLRIAPLLLLLLSLPLMAAESSLADHPSPYLAMHADDPVAWQLWDEDILKQARREQRLIYISSGYFACHWCHVMQQESFRNDAIAARVNRNFISVKIDRELWPELDATLIDFVERTRGAAGWPLNVFLTPQGHPLVGTTYLPPEEFDKFLQRLQERWKADAARLSTLAKAAALDTSGRTASPKPSLSLTEINNKLPHAFRQALHERVDMLAGGFGEQAKFPQAPLLTAMMMLELDEELEDFLHLTLDQMATSGLRDQLGGGFFRYTVDPGWREPHFEKMLSDNAQLAKLYLQAGERFNSEAYYRIGIDTLDFMLREMRHQDGAFISALSAVDKQGKEGGYYLWTKEQLVSALGDEDAAVAQTLWGMTGSSPYEHGYLPLPQAEMTHSKKGKRLSAALLRYRQQRTLPRDDKRLAAWNAMALIALSAAHGEGERFVAAGKEVRDYLHKLWDGQRLWRMVDVAGKLYLPAGLQDYGQVARALLSWERVSGDTESRKLAVKLVAKAWRYFYSEAGWLPGGDSALIGKRRLLLSDGALPSPVTALFEANSMLGEQAPISREAMLMALTADPVTLLNSPLEHSGYLILLQRLSDE